MSATRYFAVDRGTVQRKLVSGGGAEGCGHNQHLRVGRDNSGSDKLYWSLLRFALDWSQVGTILEANLLLYSAYDGDFPIPNSTDSPRVKVYQNLDAFSEGNNADEVWNSSDVTSAARATGPVSFTMTKVHEGLNRIPITDLVRGWAPASVVGGGKKTNYGLTLWYVNDLQAQQWSGASEEYPDTSKRPQIELIFEYGITVPNAPTTSLAPSGAVASFPYFTGNFSDINPADYVDQAEVEVYTNPASATAVASTNRITSAAHGLRVNDEVYFTSLTGGAGLSTFTRYYVNAVIDPNTFLVETTLYGAPVDITVDYSAMAWAKRIFTQKSPSTASDKADALFRLVPNTDPWGAGVTHAWRGRVYDQTNQVSAWSALTSFSVTNTAPTTPTLTPLNQTYATLNGVLFRGTYADADGDPMAAYQVQLAVAVPDDANQGLNLWDTGRVDVGGTPTYFETPYGGRSLAAGTYHWRARVQDNRGLWSAWASTAITLSADFNAAPGSQTTIQLRPQAPRRLVFREMAYNAVGGNVTGVAATDVFTSASAHGLSVGEPVRFSALTGGTGLVVGQTYYVLTTPTTVTYTLQDALGVPVNFTTNITAGTLTKVTTRGPGNVVCVLEDAKSTGASIMYNSPGELHFTLPTDHWAIDTLEPKLTHYTVEVWSGDGWRPVFDGLLWDFDANDQDIVYYGLDYLGLYDLVPDERFDPSNPDKPTTSGGSKYVDKTISYVVADVLNLAKSYQYSPVGFIDVGAIATMSEHVTLWSTMVPPLQFVSGLLDSHRKGVGLNTRIQVRRKTGGFEVVVIEHDIAAAPKSDLRLRYGEMVQGYRVIPFGQNWASRQMAIGRTREGVRVLYRAENAPGINPAVWGRISQVSILDGVADENDFIRRTQQAAIHAGKLGKQVALGIRSGILGPLDGYDICDALPVEIIHGAVDTTAYGSGYWVVYGLAWEVTDAGATVTNLTLLPREDTTAPDVAGITPSSPISTQDEWQIGWTPPAVAGATSTIWLDQTTGIVYRRGPTGDLIAAGITGSV